MKCLFYVGCATDEHRQGIYTFVADCETGEFSQIGTAVKTVDPIYFVLNKTKTLLYSIETDPTLPAESSGCAVCYRLDGPTPGAISRTMLQSPVPCYCALSTDEKLFAWGDYRTAVFGISPLNSEGAFEESISTHWLQNTGKGPSSPRQDSAHVHCVEFGPDNRLYVTDLGTDEILCAEFAGKKLSLVPERRVQCRAASGPRHILFHPTQSLLFLICELDNTIASYHRNEAGQFIPIGYYSTLPEGFSGTSKCAAIRISADGTLLFASNRGHNSVAVFQILQDGALGSPVISLLQGTFPRDFELLPGEKFIVVGHKTSNEIQMYAFDKTTRLLSPVHRPFPVHRPLVFKTGRRV